MDRRRGQLHIFARIVTSCKGSKILILSGMIMDRVAVRASGLMGRVMLEAVPVQVFTVTRAGMAIKAIRATKVVIIIKEISSSSTSRVTRATRSS